MRLKTLMFMAVLPSAALLAPGGGGEALLAYTLAVSVAAIVLAVRGRSGVASRYFPARVTLYAPLWVLERAVSVYWALYWRYRYGGYPFGDRLLSKGTGEAWIPGGRLNTLGVTYTPGRPHLPHEPR